jgi:hypothetical protein
MRLAPWRAERGRAHPRTSQERRAPARCARCVVMQMPHPVAPLSPWPSRMTPRAQDPKAWRRRASELRSFAQRADDPVAKRQLLELADNWDDLARRTERVEMLVA